MQESEAVRKIMMGNTNCKRKEAAPDEDGPKMI